MNITQEKKNDLNALIKIDIEKADYEARVNKSLKEYGKKVTLKGFRQGKVPVGIVKKMFGNQILAEELNKILSENLDQYLKENNLDILGSPMPVEENNQQEIDINNPGNFQFTYEIGLTPDFAIKALDNKETLEKYEIEADADLVDEEIENMRKRFGERVEVEEVENDDILKVRMIELTEAGEPKEEGINTETSVPTDLIKEENRKEVYKLKKEESMLIDDVFTFFDRQREDILKHILNVKPEDAGETGSKFRMTIEGISRLKEADVDQELFDKVFGPDAVASEDEFRQKIKEELEKIMQRESDQKLNHDIYHKLLDETEVGLPDDFLKRWIVQTNEKPVTPEQVEEEYDSFRKNLKWNLIVNKLSKEKNIEVSKEDLEDKVKSNLQLQMSSYGQQLTEEQLNDFSRRMLSNKEHVQSTYENLMQEKLFEEIKKGLIIEEKKVSYNEFLELSKHEH